MSTPDRPPVLNGNPIADTAIRQPIFILMFMILLVVVGLLGYRALPVNFLPDFSIATVTVNVGYPGADPETVADQIAKPVEDTLTTIPGISHITSTANEGSAQFTIEFDDSVAPTEAIQDVREKVNAVIPRLPDGVQTPIFRQFDPNSSPVLQLAVASRGKMTPLELRTYIDDVAAPLAERVPGVGAVDVSGGQQRQIHVYLQLDRLQALQIAPSQVSNAIGAANTNLGLGTINSSDQTITLRTTGLIKQPADIAQLPIGNTGHVVGDVAVVQDGVAEPTSYARLDGQDAVAISVRKQPGSNTAQVAGDARNALARLFARNADLNFIVPNDQSVQVNDAVSSSIQEIILAVVAAMLVVLLFFRDLRNTLVTIAGLPIIIISTFAALWVFGVTINIISLLALSLSVGLVIDDAIVVRENIFRHLERGESPMVAASRGTSQVALSVLAMTTTIIAVFLPVALVSGTTGIFFKSFGITAACAMAISLVEAFTFAPMLSSHLFSQRAVPQQTEAEAAEQAGLPDEAQVTLRGFERSYERLLRWSLRRRWVSVGITIVMLIISLAVARGLQLSFLPSQASDTFGLSFQAPPGTALSKTNQLARQAEAIIGADPDVRALQTTVGSAGAPESASFTVRVKDLRQTNAVRARLRPKLSFLPGLALSTQGFRGGTGADVTGRNIQVQLQSNRPPAEIASIAQRIQQQIQQLPGITDVGLSYTQGRPELQFAINRTATRELNLDSRDLSTSLRALVSGDTATTWQQNGDDIDVVVQLPPDARTDIDAIRNITLPTSNGNVPLTAVASISPSTGPTSVRRYDRFNEIVIGANAAPGVDQNALERQIQGRIAQLGLPDDVTITFGGQSQNQRQGFSGLFVAMGLSVLFVYMVLASQFGSLLQPLVIMLAMPFSFLGAFVALRIAGLPLDITSLIGLIMLLGLVVKNSILLVDFTNRLRRAGMPKHEALARAGGVRLRPILMTSTAIMAGALPTALGIHFAGSGQGSEFRRGLAIVLIGGMLTSTLLTLLVVPTAYSLLESLTRRVGGLLHRKAHPMSPLAPMLAVGGAGGSALPIAGQSVVGEPPTTDAHATSTE